MLGIFTKVALVRQLGLGNRVSTSSEAAKDDRDGMFRANKETVALPRITLQQPLINR
jgi:hypothetical protein